MAGSSYEHAERSGSLNYLTPWANLANDPNVGEVDYSGAYYQAPMTSNAVKLLADYPVSEQLSADLFLQWKEDNYTYPPATRHRPQRSPDNRRWPGHQERFQPDRHAESQLPPPR